MLRRAGRMLATGKMPKRRAEMSASSTATASDVGSSSAAPAPAAAAAPGAKRPKRAAASEAVAKIKASVEADAQTEAAAAGASSYSGGGASSSSSAAAAAPGGGASAVVTVVPGNVPGYTPPASLYTQPPPTRDAKGRLVFADHPEFTPNLTPKEVLQAGAFGGGYFRTIRSGVTGKTYVDAWREFPPDWFAGLDVRKRVAAPTYDARVNRYGVSCGQGLLEWESSGWIASQDPFGWFHWYCRFTLGRRSEDDARQISRWAGVAGAKGRWKQNLIAKCVAAGAPYNDASVSPVVRQTLLHWAYELTADDFGGFARTYAQTGRAPYIPAVAPASSSASSSTAASSSSSSAAAGSGKKNRR
jgi:hypothetical protein